jgi:hypothetical protein
MEQRTLSTYAAALLPELPREAFARHPGRLAWLFLHLAVATGAIVVIAVGWLFRTPRIHLTAETLVEPRSGRRWPTLLPRDGAADPRRLA